MGGREGRLVSVCRISRIEVGEMEDSVRVYISEWRGRRGREVDNIYMYRTLCLMLWDLFVGCNNGCLLASNI